MEDHFTKPPARPTELPAGRGYSPPAQRQPPSDRAAWLEELYARYAPRVYSFALFRVRNSSDAEDITAETFEHALASYGRYDPSRGRLVSWLFGIAHRRVLRHRRRSNRRRSVDGGDEIARRQPARHPNPEELAVLGAQKAEALDALCRLRERDRTLIALRYQGDLDNGEIARLLRMRKQTVAVAIHRALDRLRHELDKENEHDSTK